MGLCEPSVVPSGLRDLAMAAAGLVAWRWPPRASWQDGGRCGPRGTTVAAEGLHDIAVVTEGLHGIAVAAAGFHGTTVAAAGFRNPMVGGCRGPP